MHGAHASSRNHSLGQDAALRALPSELKLAREILGKAIAAATRASWAGLVRASGSAATSFSQPEMGARSGRRCAADYMLPATHRLCPSMYRSPPCRARAGVWRDHATWCEPAFEHQSTGASSIRRIPIFAFDRGIRPLHRPGRPPAPSDRDRRSAVTISTAENLAEYIDETRPPRHHSSR